MRFEFVKSLNNGLANSRILLLEQVMLQSRQVTVCWNSGGRSHKYFQLSNDNANVQDSTLKPFRGCENAAGKLRLE